MYSPPPANLKPKPNNTGITVRWGCNFLLTRLGALMNQISYTSTLYFRVSLGVLGRHLPSEVVSFFLSLSLVLSWLITGHWLLMDLLSMGLCVSLIAHIRLPSLKVSIILLLSLLVYDVFWVFFSSLIFSSNVMVHVATQPADNPVTNQSRLL